ncbi:MAG: TonB-dependent receptor [Xanthomonadaceae bacterium]|nr:TonB-dependent receptor [Xanthomonadaceae bacterium]MDE1884857.1 TonB-dependent receptor [Xanthomonadaceae bacterium]MDE2085073.1 TonB-dependent receptor [Xanthomonadaceae bacterium]
MTRFNPRLLAAGISAALGGLMLSTVATPVLAQNKPGNDVQKLEAIEVTGSRIKKAEIADQTPVITISAKDIAQTGLASIGDVIQQLSVSGSALNTKFNSAGNFGFAPDGSGVGSGSTTISLRNLNAKRTLILVDGLRWVNESSASGVSAAVDLNTIPAGIVERIEILTDGASALYGSDAIAGVINIITKKNQDGAALHAYYGDYSVGDGKTGSGDISFGGKGDRYSFFVDISHYKQNRISSADWAQASSACVPGTGLSNCSSATPFTRVLFDTPGGTDFGGLCPGGFCSITANGVAGPGGVQNFPSGYHHFTSADRFNFAPYNLLLTPSERTGFFAQTDYKLTDNIHWYMKGLYNTRKSVNQAAPEPIFLGQAFCFLIDRCYNVGVDKTNPYNPFGFTLDPSSPDFGLARRPVEGGPRIFSQHVDTRYFATGLTGSFGWNEHNYNWDVNVVRADNNATQDVTGTYNMAHIQEGLGSLATCQADPSCVPLNFFGGPGTLTPDMLNYILYHEHDTSHQALGVVTANISGDLFQLPAGSLDFAAGYEHRNLSGTYQPDAVVVAGESNGVPSKPTSGGYDVNEYYVELNAPLVADAPLVKALNVDVATRYSDYSTFGGTTNSKLGLRWQLNDDLTLRGTYAQGFRAPSIGELYGTFSRFDASLTDPCNFNSPIASPAVAANCAKLGVPNPATFQQSNSQISVLTGGNRDLQPEKSRNTTLGAVYSPSWAENTAWSQKMDFELTWYKIKVNNAIQAKDAQTLLNRCAETLDPAFCSLQSRNGAGYVAFLNDTLGNLGRVDTRGFDFGVTWVGPDTGWGRLGASWQNTYVDKYSAIDTTTGLAEPDGVGIEVHDSGIPRIRSTLRLNWTYGEWSAGWAMRYLSALTEDCSAAGGFPICHGAPTAQFPDGSNHLGATTYNDVRASWNVPVSMPLTVSAGVNNVFAKDPPICLSCSLNGYDASTYDLPGRFWYVEANLKF